MLKDYVNRQYNTKKEVGRNTSRKIWSNYFSRKKSQIIDTRYASKDSLGKFFCRFCLFELKQKKFSHCSFARIFKRKIFGFIRTLRRKNKSFADKKDFKKNIIRHVACRIFKIYDKKFLVRHYLIQFLDKNFQDLDICFFFLSSFIEKNNYIHFSKYLNFIFFPFHEIFFEVTEISDEIQKIYFSLKKNDFSKLAFFSIGLKMDEYDNDKKNQSFLFYSSELVDKEITNCQKGQHVPVHPI